MKIAGKILLFLIAVLAVGAGFVMVRFSSKASKVFHPPKFTIHDDVTHADVDLGKRIFTIRNGCAECHGANLAGVQIMDNPAMGSISGANLTQLKDWSDEEIAAAIRYGIKKDGHSLQFMPSFDFVGLSKSDVAALVAYIRSAPEVSTEFHKNTFGPVARALAVFGKMPVLFPAFEIDMTAGFADKPQEGATIEFGKYLANSCAGCHGESFRGGKIPGGDPSWPEASNIRFGSDSFWTEEKFQQTIATGVSAKTGRALRAPMPVQDLKQMNETEIKALWLYLDSLK